MNHTNDAKMEPQSGGRRRFLDYLLGTSAGMTLIAVFYPVIKFMIPPEVIESAQASVVAGKVKELNLALNTTIVTYCGGIKCPSSKQAADKLASLGYTNVWAYEGGLQDWTEGGLPLVKL